MEYVAHISAFSWAFSFSTVAVLRHDRHHRTDFLYYCFPPGTSSNSWGWGGTAEIV